MSAAAPKTIATVTVLVSIGRHFVQQNGMRPSDAIWKAWSLLGLDERADNEDAVAKATAKLEESR